MQEELAKAYSGGTGRRSAGLRYPEQKRGTREASPRQDAALVRAELEVQRDVLAAAQEELLQWQYKCDELSVGNAVRARRLPFSQAEGLLSLCWTGAQGEAFTPWGGGGTEGMHVCARVTPWRRGVGPLKHQSTLWLVMMGFTDGMRRSF